MSSEWEFLQDDEQRAWHLQALSATVASMGKFGAGSGAMSARGDDDELLAMYAAVKVDGLIVGFHLDAAEGRILWAVQR